MDPASAELDEIDDVNDETFGSGAVEDDWESKHQVLVQSEGIPLANSKGLHRDDVIAKVTSDQEELESSFASMKLKELWPSSPVQGLVQDSIWSSPEVPRSVTKTPSHPPPHGGRVISVEELEREFTSSSPPPPPHSSPHIFNPPHTSPLPPHSSPLTPKGKSPPPPHLMYIPRPPLHARMPHPVHPFLGHVWPIRAHLPPPPPHLLPPHMLHHPHPHTSHPPPGIHTYPIRQGPHPHHPPLPPSLPLLRTPPHPHLHHPHTSHLHSSHIPPSHIHPSHLHPSQVEQQRPKREKSRRSELLSEMKPDGSGFMTQKEKEWIIKVQLLQLQTSDPANDDYYYQKYIEKKADHDSSFSSVLTLPQIHREEKTYRPIEFEQVLGRISRSSINTPRKMIDAPFSVEGGGGKEISARKRQILLIIEKLYTLVLSLEELERQALAVTEDDRGPLLVTKEMTCREIFHLLRLKMADNETHRSEEQIFQQVNSYRKGKRLTRRLLPLLTKHHAQAVLLALVRNMSLITKRDNTDQILPELIPAVTKVISTCDLQLLTLCLSCLLPHPGLNSTTTPAVVKIAGSEFGSVVLLGLVQRGQIFSSSSFSSIELKELWSTSLHHLASTLLPHSSQLLQALSTNRPLLATLASLQ